MTPFVQLQEQIIETLRKLKEKDIELLKRWHIISKLKAELGPEDKKTLKKTHGFEWPISPELAAHIGPIVVEQIVENGASITIANLLGSPLFVRKTVDLEEYLREVGSGSCNLRTKTAAQPGALCKGDRLATGEKLISEPREGGNGQVLLHLQGGTYGAWIPVAARIPIALQIDK